MATRSRHASLRLAFVLAGFRLLPPVVPLLAAVADGPGGTLPASQAGITVSRPGVLVTAFCANPDGEGTLLRLWDQSGVSGPVNIVFPQGLHATVLQPIDLRGRKSGEPIVIQEGTARLLLGAFAPASFLLQP